MAGTALAATLAHVLLVRRHLTRIGTIRSWLIVKLSTTLHVTRLLRMPESIYLSCKVAISFVSRGPTVTVGRRALGPDWQQQTDTRAIYRAVEPRDGEDFNGRVTTGIATRVYPVGPP